jgi:hypothetical protein
MNPIKLQDLYDGVKISARFARRDTEDGCAPDWGQPKTVTLFVMRSEKDLKQGRKVIRPAGTIVELAVKDFGWASYEEDDFCPEYNEFLAEEYRMQILKIEDAALQTEKPVV